jgi:Xaa-Pro aminopeptidase
MTQYLDYIKLIEKYNLTNYNVCSQDVLYKINNLRIEKDIWELIQIQDAIEKTFTSFTAMVEILNTPNLNESNFEAIFMKTLIDNRFTIAYLPICAGDSNASFIHYSKNNCKVRNNILLDCGARNPYGYCADITRSYMIQDNLLFKKVFNIVNQSKIACENYISIVLKNRQIPNFNRLNDICIETFIKLLPEILPTYLEVNRNTVGIFYTHFIGHHVGLNVHDIHYDNIVVNSVFTIEPGLYFNKDIIKIDINPELFKLGGIRIEDMYYITPEMTLVCLSSHI